MSKILEQKIITSSGLTVAEWMPDSGWWLSALRTCLSRSLFTYWLSLSVLVLYIYKASRYKLEKISGAAVTLAFNGPRGREAWMGLRLKRRCFRGRVQNFGLLLASWTTPVTSEFWVLILREEEGFDFQEEDGCMRESEKRAEDIGYFWERKRVFFSWNFWIKNNYFLFWFFIFGLKIRGSPVLILYFF